MWSYPSFLAAFKGSHMTAPKSWLLSLVVQNGLTINLTQGFSSEIRAPIRIRSIFTLESQLCRVLVCRPSGSLLKLLNGFGKTCLSPQMIFRNGHTEAFARPPADPCHPLEEAHDNPSRESKAHVVRKHQTSAVIFGIPRLDLK